MVQSMKAVQNFILACVLAVSLSACDRAVPLEPRWGSRCGLRPIPGDSTLGLTYELQGEWHESTVVRPVFVILWKSEINGGSTWGHGGGTCINGHPLAISLTNRAVYALQPDYTLRDMGLSEPGLSTVLNAIAKDAPIEGGLWTNELAPRLCIVQ
jgi:hypothetical protein